MEKNEKVQRDFVQEIKDLIGEENLEAFTSNNYYCKSRKEFYALDKIIGEMVKSNLLDLFELDKVKILDSTPKTLIKYHKYVGKQCAKHIGEIVEGYERNESTPFITGKLLGIESGGIDHYAVVELKSGQTDVISFFDNIKFADNSWLYPKEELNICKLVEK